MKRIFALLMAMAICLSLCACGKSQSVKDVEAAIDAIGEVTLDSGDAIEKAESLYDFLTDSEKTDVENKGTLVEARNTYDKLLAAKIYTTAKEAYELINKAYKLYLYDGFGVHQAKEFGLTTNATLKDSDFCKRLADATSDATGILKLTEQEIRDGLQYCCDNYGYTEDMKADWTVCWTIFQNTFAHKYQPWDDMESAGVLLLELKDTYHDEKYYPILKEYFDFVATGYNFHMDVNNTASRLTDYQSTHSQYMQQLDPMFVN